MTEAEQQYQDIRDEINTLKAILIGPQGDNGVRGSMRALNERVTAVAEDLHDKWFIQRPKDCIGRKLFEEHTKEHDLMTRENVDFQKFFLEFQKNNRQTAATLIGSILTFAGVIGVALIGLLK